MATIGGDTMAIPDQFLDELSSRLNIVDVVSAYVPLTRKGGNYWGLCPFHREKTPSFSVNESKQIFHCFGCGKGGGAVRFVMEMENLPFPEAVRKLAAQAGMEVPEDNSNGAWREKRQRILELNKEAARFYRSMLSQPEGAQVAEYIAKKRRISPKFSARFGLGAAPNAWDRLILAMREKGYDKADLIEAGLAVAGKNGGIYDKYRNRLMLPVIDVRGNVIGFTSRVMDDSTPKYLNTPETAIFKKRSILYGLNYAKNTKRPNMILVEGNIDVITLHQAGFDNTIATMGTALTEEHIRILEKYTQELVLCYDNDNAGQLATQRALELLNNSEFSVKVLKLPNRMVDGKPTKQDADDFIKNYGPAAFENLLSGSENGVEFRMTQIAARYDLTSDEGRIGYAGEMAEELCRLENAVERDVYTNRAAQTAGLSPEAMKLEVQRAFKRRAARDRKARERQELNLTRSLQPADRAIRYDDLRSAMAEEGVIRLLMQDDSLFPDQPPLREDEFSSPLLGRIYGELWRCRGSGSSMAALSASLTPEEMSHLTTLLQKPESTANAPQALADYIRIIREEGVKRSGRSAMDALAAARDTYKDKKGYGGKRT